MGQITVDEVTVESYMETEKILTNMLEGSTLKVSFISSKGNGATVNLILHPTHFDEELKTIFLSDPIQERLDDIGLEVSEKEE